MARSPKDDPRYNDNTWNYAAEAANQCTPGGLNERKQPPITSASATINESNMYTNTSFGNDIYANKNPFNVQSRDAVSNSEDKLPYGNMQSMPPVNRQAYGNAVLRLSNGQAVRVFYDENNQQLIFPMSSQYELFSHNQGPLDMPLQSSQAPHMFTLNQDYSPNNNIHIPSTPPPQNNYVQENINQTTNTLTTDFLKVLRDNWEPNSTGTYSPFGQNHPLNHPDAPTLNLPNNPLLDNKPQPLKPESSPKRNENGPLADTNNKKRIVAEVKPMRPSYSDVLVKNTKNNTQTETVRRTKPQNVETKPSNIKTNSKLDKPPSNIKQSEENKLKSEKKHQSTISSGSESGDVNTDDTEKPQKPSKKSRNKRSNITRKWSSLDDITNEEDANYEHNNESQFMFIENQEKPLKKEKKCDKKAKADKNAVDDEFKEEDDDQSQFVFQESPTDPAKVKKKKDARNYHKVTKPVQDKKKASQSKVRRNKPGYLGLAQNYLEHWGGQTWKALVWFAYLISDIAGMSLHLLFDL